MSNAYKLYWEERTLMTTDHEQLRIDDSPSGASPEYITVADFAERAGVTKAAVYDRLNKDLNKYLIEIDGKKMVDAAALAFVGKKSSIESSNIQDSSKLIEHLNVEIRRLQAEIERKDALIAEKDRLIASYTERFAAAVEQSQQIAKQALDTAGQAQLLHAITETSSASEEQQNPWRQLINRIRKK